MCRESGSEPHPLHIGPEQAWCMCTHVLLRCCLASQPPLTLVLQVGAAHVLPGWLLRLSDAHEVSERDQSLRSLTIRRELQVPRPSVAHFSLFYSWLCAYSCLCTCRASQRSSPISRRHFVDGQYLDDQYRWPLHYYSTPNFASFVQRSLHSWIDVVDPVLRPAGAAWRKYWSLDMARSSGFQWPVLHSTCMQAGKPEVAWHVSLT